MPHEPHWLIVLVYLAGGFLLLAKGADWLVTGSSQVARRLGISTLIIALTVVAFGTSAPEIVVSSLAAWQGLVDLSLGNVLGSNIANIGLVLGACALVLPRVLEARLALREIAWLIASLGILWAVAGDRSITRADAVLLLGAFFVYNFHLFLGAKREALEKGAEAVLPVAGESRFPGLWVVVGILSISVGAKLVLDGSIAGASKLGIPESVVGLTIVAVGTSLPELAAGLGGAFKGESDISLGNVVGSNVFNLLGVIGIVGLIQPLDPSHHNVENPAGLTAAFDSALREDVWVVLAFSLCAIALPFLGGARAGRAKGAFLLVSYVAYNVWLFRSRT